MLIVLSGKTCAGKSAVQAKLMNVFGCQRIVTYTTRPMREGEKDGESYHFLSKEEFLKKEKEGFFLEYAKYDTLVGGNPDSWYYGSAKEDYRKASEDPDNIYVVILQQAGLKALKAAGMRYAAILLDVTDETILARQSRRNDDVTEAKRRIAADREAFRGISGLVDSTIKVDEVGVEEAARLVLNVAGCLTAYSKTKTPSEVADEGYITFQLNGGFSEEVAA